MGPKGRKNMGKKKIISKTKEELLKERERVESKLKKEIKVKSSRKLGEANVFIFSSYNNTMLTLADPQGNVLSWATAGSVGFKGTKKATPFAASRVAEVLSRTIKKLGIEKIHVTVKGIGAGRESAVRSLANKGVNIVSITDATPIPHNGCRPPKPRRV